MKVYEKLKFYFLEKKITYHSCNYDCFLQDVARPTTESKPNKKEEFLDLRNGSESAFEDHKTKSKKDDKHVPDPTFEQCKT